MRYFFLMCVFLFLPLQSFAEVKIIELRYRAPADLVAQIRELLADGEKIAAAGDHLVLIAAGESLLAAEKMIALLDRPLINLQIQIRQTAELQHVGQEASAGIRYGNRTGLSTSTGVGFKRGNSITSQEQTLLLVEGGRGLIEVGREMPFTEQ